jgi:drug/metabolite transporter (DMT)-like permease
MSLADQLTSAGGATKPIYVALMIIAVIAVAVADVCLKRAAGPGSLTHALRSPWTLVAVALYLIQVALFVVVFVNGWKLSVVGVVQTTLYAVVTLGAGVLLFGEMLSLMQTLGLAFAVVGVVLLSL